MHRFPSVGGMTESTSPRPRLFLRLNEAAEACGVSQDVMRAAVQTGNLRAKRAGKDGGGLYLFRPADLEAWFDRLEDA